MPASNLSPQQRRHVQDVVSRAAHPAYELLEANGLLEGKGMRLGSARDTYAKLLWSTIELIAGREAPTDAAFGRYGGPAPDRARRFLQRAPLDYLPPAHVACAAQEGLIAAPSGIIIESRTEECWGPNKYAVHHMQPPGVDAARALALKGVSHTRGGIASMLAFAECGATSLPCGLEPIAQHWWLPENWGGRLVSPSLVEPQLRALARLGSGGLTGDPGQIAATLLRKLQTIADWRDVELAVDGLVVMGGRLRVGHPAPVPGTAYGRGDTERYLGCRLGVLDQLRRHRLVAFLELPSQADDDARLRRISTEPPDWEARVGGVDITPSAAESTLQSAGGQWREIEADVVDRFARRGGTRVHRLATTASGADVPSMAVQLVIVTDWRGRHSLFVTTMRFSEDQHAVEQLARIAIAETERRYVGSAHETAVESLLRHAQVQSNPRLRYDDRSGYAGLAQVAHAVLQIAGTVSDS